MGLDGLLHDPSPSPPPGRERSARQKRSNTRAWSSGAMPGPSSQTATETQSRSRVEASRIREPAGAWRTALSRRFEIARLSASVADDHEARFETTRDPDAALLGEGVELVAGLGSDLGEVGLSL